jgi:formate hydrogenlyase subunit 3/multisubunit Na+/H+ antiporter MnhD subunit
MVERRCGTGDLEALGGMARGRPVLATVLLVAGMIALAVPGSVTFAGEFLIMAGAYENGWGYAAVVALGIVLAAMYVLRLISAVLHVRPGPAVRDEALDLRPGELALVLPLVACLFALSAWPALVSQSSFPDNKAGVSLATNFATGSAEVERVANQFSNLLGFDGPCRDAVETDLARAAPDAKTLDEISSLVLEAERSEGLAIGFYSDDDLPCRASGP